MRLLFVENNDSFSWNVVDRLPVDRSSISVVSSTQPEEIRRQMATADAVVIGPGPLDPERAHLGWVVTEAIERGLPVLGICLGCQAVGLAFGARLVRVPPCHGRRWWVHFQPSRLFPNLTGPIEVMRYHSLALTDVRLPLRVIAQTSERVVMAIEHESLPVAGLQFHPDSFATPRGEEILASFFRTER